MNISVKFIYLFLLAILASCTEKNNQPSLLHENCPTGYKPSDFEYIENYYRGFVNDKSEYLAYKEITSFGYKLVSIINTNGIYTLSISLPVMPNTTISKKLELKNVQDTFNRQNAIKSLHSIYGGEAFHATCVMVGKNISGTTLTAGIYNPPILLDEYPENSTLQLYSKLKLIADTQLPDHNADLQRLYTANLKPQEIGGRIVYENNYVNPTKDENKKFINKLINTPFFEFEKYITH